MTSELTKFEPEDTGSVLPLIRQAATDPQVSVEKMERLFALQERWEKREAEKKFHVSMIAARAEMPEVGKDSKGENCKYAKLEKIDRLIYPVYTKNGFSLQWSEAECQTVGWTRLKCVVLHSGGHREEHFLQGPMDDKGPKGGANKTGIQGMGSTWSYLQRRLLAMIFNIRIVGDDNDGGAPKNQQAPSAQRGPDGKPLNQTTTADPVKAAKKKLWDTLRDVRGDRQDWDTANEWLRFYKILTGSQTVASLTAEQLTIAEEKASIQLRQQ